MYGGLSDAIAPGGRGGVYASLGVLGAYRVYALPALYLRMALQPPFLAEANDTARPRQLVKADAALVLADL